MDKKTNPWDKKIIECYKKALIVGKVNFNMSNIDANSLLSLRVFFIKYPKFLSYRFFYAPIFLNRLQKIKDEYPLKRYVEKSSIKFYTDYMNFLDENEVDYSLNYIKESFFFIRDFCKINKISANQYFSYKKPDDAQKVFLKHLNARRISPYVLCFFGEGEEKLLELTPDEIKYYLNSRVSYFDKKNHLIRNKPIKEKILEIKNKIL